MLAFVYKPKFFKQTFYHHLDNCISFPLIYRFVGVRCVLTELRTENWKHCSKWTVILTGKKLFWPLGKNIELHSIIDKEHTDLEHGDFSFDRKKLVRYMFTFCFICQCQERQNSNILLVFSHNVCPSNYQGLTSWSCSFSDFVSCEAVNKTLFAWQIGKIEIKNDVKWTCSKINTRWYARLLSVRRIYLFAFHGFKMKTTLS